MATHNNNSITENLNDILKSKTFQAVSNSVLDEIITTLEIKPALNFSLHTTLGGPLINSQSTPNKQIWITDLIMCVYSNNGDAEGQITVTIPSRVVLGNNSNNFTFKIGCPDSNAATFSHTFSGRGILLDGVLTVSNATAQGFTTILGYVVEEKKNG